MVPKTVKQISGGEQGVLNLQPVADRDRSQDRNLSLEAAGLPSELGGVAADVRDAENARETSGNRRQNRNTVEDHLVAADEALEHVRNRRRDPENADSGRATSVRDGANYCRATADAGAEGRAAADGLRQAVPTEGVVGVVPGSSISNRASEAPVLLLKTRLVTSVLFNATVMLAVGTEVPSAERRCRQCKRSRCRRATQHSLPTEPASGWRRSRRTSADRVEPSHR